MTYIDDLIGVGKLPEIYVLASKMIDHSHHQYFRGNWSGLTYH